MTLALPASYWCVAANVVHARAYGPAGAEQRKGTKHFAPGAKVYVFNVFGGMGGESLTVVGRHRKSKRWIVLSMRSMHLANWRLDEVYHPEVIRLISEWEIERYGRFNPHTSKASAEALLAYANQGAGQQAFNERVAKARHKFEGTDD